MGQDISTYISAHPPEIRAMLERMRAIIRKAAPKASEAIAWDMPTFKQDGNLVHFAAFKKHMSLFASTSTLTRFKGRGGRLRRQQGHHPIPLRQRPPRRADHETCEVPHHRERRKSRRQAAAQEVAAPDHGYVNPAENPGFSHPGARDRVFPSAFIANLADFAYLVLTPPPAMFPPSLPHERRRPYGSRCRQHRPPR